MHPSWLFVYKLDLLNKRNAEFNLKALQTIESNRYQNEPVALVDLPALTGLNRSLQVSTGLDNHLLVSAKNLEAC